MSAFLDSTTCSCGREFYRFSEKEVRATCGRCGDRINWVEREQDPEVEVETATPHTTEQATLNGGPA